MRNTQQQYGRWSDEAGWNHCGDQTEPSQGLFHQLESGVRSQKMILTDPSPANPIRKILSIKFIYLTYRICYKNFWIKFVRHIISFFFLALMKLYSMASAQMWWSTRIQGNSSTVTQYTTWPARNWPQILDVSKPN